MIFLNPNGMKRICWAHRFEEEELSRLLDTLKRAPVQYRMLCKWIDYCEEQGVDFINREDFSRLIGESATALKALCDREILKINSVEVHWHDEDERGEREVNRLSDTQEFALKQIRDSFKKKDCVLLQGVTSFRQNRSIYSFDTGSIGSRQTGVVPVAGNCVDGTDREEITKSFR